MSAIDQIKNALLTLKNFEDSFKDFDENFEKFEDSFKDFDETNDDRKNKLLNRIDRTIEYYENLAHIIQNGTQENVEEGEVFMDEMVKLLNKYLKKTVSKNNKKSDTKVIYC